MSDRCRLRIALWVTLSLGFAWVAPAVTKEAESRYQTVPANADGIGKAYMGRQIARVMGFQGAAWLEREEREREERSDLLLQILAPASGSIFADVGAGTGYYTRRIADLVGPTGRVYAVDVQPEMFSMLQSVAKQRGYSHITPVLSDVRDVKLSTSSVDVAIMVDVHHELEFPYEVLAS